MSSKQNKVSSPLPFPNPPKKSSRGGLFDENTDEGSSFSPPCRAPPPTPTEKRGGGLFVDEDDSLFDPPSRAPPPSSEKRTTRNLFDDGDEDLFSPRPPARPSRTGSLFADSDDEEDKEGYKIEPKQSSTLSRKVGDGKDTLFVDEDDNSEDESTSLFGREDGETASYTETQTYVLKSRTGTSLFGDDEEDD